MKPDWTKEETNAARSLRDSGLTYATIGKRVGRTAQGVKRRLQYVQEFATPSPPHPIGSEIKPELVKRMAAVLRGYVAGSCAMAYGPNEDRSVYAEAVAIVSELPAPVDTDLIEASKINDWSPYDLTEMDPRAAQRVVEQVRDAILAGIKRGRELATPTSETDQLGGVGV